MYSLPAKTKILLILAIDFWKIEKFSPSAPFHMKTRVRLKYFADNCRKTSRKMDLSKLTRDQKQRLLKATFEDWKLKYRLEEI